MGKRLFAASGADVCDLDRTYAEMARKIVAKWNAVQTVEHARQGEACMVIVGDYRMGDDLAALFAEFREMYLGPVREARDAEAE